MKIRPKNVIVVGGSSGIGFSTAQRLLDYGVETITLASTNKTKLEKALEELYVPSGAKAYYIIFDIADVKNHMNMIQKVQENTFSVVDGIVISSGKFFHAGNWAGFNIPEEKWDEILDINLKGPFFLIRNFSNYLISNKHFGNICVVSSISAKRDLLGIYQLTKNALSRTVFAYGKYLPQFDIILNAIEPGVTNTNINYEYHKRFSDGIRAGQKFERAAINRLIRPEEIAEIICFLMSELGEVMSGTCLLASGGEKSIPF